ncbi:MAG: hypothetical protein NTW11_02245 [Candidatus Staskawiczbacteria bacterium]|nr:hypothetical protein [Candidatus Staskawiczbacteria bacterium]
MTEEKWQKLSFAEQMGNIGSEVARAFSLKQKADKDNSEKSFFRALELIDLTIKNRKHHLLEIFRLREVLCDAFKLNSLKVKPESLNKYFIKFALCA